MLYCDYRHRGKNTEGRNKCLLYTVPIGSSAVKSAETIRSDGISKCEKGFTRVCCTGWGTGCNGGTVTALTVNWAGRQRCVSHTCPHATARVTVTGKQDKHFHPTCSDSLTRLLTDSTTLCYIITSLIFQLGISTSSWVKYNSRIFKSLARNRLK